MFKKQEVEKERVKEEGNSCSALLLCSITSPTKEPGEVWGLCQLSAGTAYCSDGCFCLFVSTGFQLYIWPTKRMPR